MFVYVAFLGIISFVVLVVVAVMVARSFRRSQDRRRTATPSGILYGPTDAELRRTREVHPAIESSRECLHCGAIYDFDEDTKCFFATCQCSFMG